MYKRKFDLSNLPIVRISSCFSPSDKEQNNCMSVNRAVIYDSYTCFYMGYMKPLSIINKTKKHFTMRHKRVTNIDCKMRDIFKVQIL